MRNSTSNLLALSYLFLLTLVLSPLSAWSLSPAEYYSRGRELLSQGKNLEAASNFEKAMNGADQKIMSMYYLGTIYSKRAVTFDQAEELLLEIPNAAMSIDQKPRNDIIFLTGLELSKLYIKTGKSNAAISLIRSIMASAPKSSPMDEAHNALGLAYYYERLYEKAIFEFRKAISLNADNVDARFNLKTLRARLEHYQAGRIYSRMGERIEAINQYRKAINLDPRFVEARVRLGLEFMKYGDSYTALRELQRAESISSSYGNFFEIWYAEGLALAKMNRSDEAMSRFAMAIEANPRFAPAHNEMGLIFIDRGKYEEAVNQFVTAIGIDAKTEYVKNMLLAISRQKSRSKK